MKKQTLSSNIRDNRKWGTVAQFLQETIKPGADLSFVSAYFTIHAFDKLRNQLEQIEKLRFLFGEPDFLRQIGNQTEGKAFRITDEDLTLRQQLQQTPIARACAAWIRAKVQIKSITQANFLHGKLYHIDNGGLVESMMGSSNFTLKGLGASPDGRNNIELNMIVDSTRDRHDLKTWFDTLWNDESLVTDMTADVLNYLAQFYKNHAPEFVYYKMLFHLFDKFIEENASIEAAIERTRLTETQIWQFLYEFQKDGVKGAINKLRKYHGCIIADSVGLGKTFEALAIIKQYELQNKRVLVLCPKQLMDNWIIYQANVNSSLNLFLNDRFGYTVLCHTDLTREDGQRDNIRFNSFNWGIYDLVVIDESHNFRNNAVGKRDEAGQISRYSRYQWLLEKVIQQGGQTDVLLLSATPVNNDLKDLRNQLYLITAGKNDAFYESMGIPDLKNTMTDAQRKFLAWAKKPKPRSRQDLLNELNSAFFKLLDEITIARSRHHVQQYYAKVIAQVGEFPQRAKPRSLYPALDLKEQFISFDQLSEEISRYRLAVFSPIEYVYDAHRDRYDSLGQTTSNFKQTHRERFLIGMMKVNFMKRLESCVQSFSQTMARTIDKIEKLEQKLTAYQRSKTAQAEISIAEDEDILEDTPEDGETIGKLSYRLEHLDIERWLTDLRQDKTQLTKIYVEAQAITPDRDGKLAMLKEVMAEKVKNPPTNKVGRLNRKLLIFTAFADTADYLYRNLKPWVQNTLGLHIAMVTGGGRVETTFGKAEFSHILTNFAPRAKYRDKLRGLPQEGEIEVLIATDCVSEGQNLQDCDWVINYDIHWNPVRLIQRFGRIDRINSQNTAIQMVNFWPTEDLNKHINLINRVESRMVLVDIAATASDNLFAPLDEETLPPELDYRTQQLLKLQTEVLDLDDFEDTMPLTEFTLDDFRQDLIHYLESNKRLLEDAPEGIYTVVPTATAAPSGVIFCLRHKEKMADAERINPLRPYYLVYIEEDMVIHFNFTALKQILGVLRQLCLGKDKPYEEACTWFDELTEQGTSMKKYDMLLNGAVQAADAIFYRRAMGQLQMGRGARLPETVHLETKDFDLVAWLVIK